MTTLPAAPLSGRDAVLPSAVFLSESSRAALAAAAIAPPYQITPLQKQRELRDAAARTWAARNAPTNVGAVADIAPCKETGGVALRLYTPPTPSCRPTVLFLHGGGWALCSILTHDELARRICVGAGCSVVSVEYRLAPEARWPAQLDDSIAGYSFASALAGTSGVVVAGDSAGGHLAAALALHLRDASRTNSSVLAGCTAVLSQPPTLPPPPIAQVLIYPAVDARCASDSCSRFAEGFGLTLPKMRWFWSHLLGSAEQELMSQPQVSPILAADLRDLPPTLVILADADVLHDEGRNYATALQRAGCRCVQLCAS